ncbi:hypothetical protein ACS0TY_035445 [Phlomoides rotata]
MLRNVLPILGRRPYSAFRWKVRRLSSEGELSSDSPPQPGVSGLTREDSVVDGCDYKHWLVVMHTPDNYPQRDEIVQQYVSTLAMALGSEKAARESIYSVSTKYYYAFSCKVAENVTHKIKYLPRVKWVLPDSYLCTEERGYGGICYYEIMSCVFLLMVFEKSDLSYVDSIISLVA